MAYLLPLVQNLRTPLSNLHRRPPTNNSFHRKVANDLLHERGTVYSSREQLPMAAQLVSGSLRPLFLPYNNVWRSGRKLMHHLAMARAADSYQPLQEMESIRLLKDLIREPEEYEKSFERYSAGLILRLAFGKVVVTGEEEYVRRILGVVHTVERVASPGAYLVDTLPWLVYLPDSIAPEGKRLHEEELELFRGLQDDIRQQMRNGKGVEGNQKNFTEKLLSEKEKWNLSDDEGAYVVGTL